MIDQTCVLCLRTAPDVRTALLRFEASGQFYFGTDARCANHRECRERADAAGLDWPLASEWSAPKAVLK